MNAVKFIFTSHGGGILRAELFKQDGSLDVTLNEHGRAAVCSLSPTAKQYADLAYRIVDKSDSSIVFEAETPEKLIIRKSYSATTGLGSDPHSLNFKLTITNAGTERQTRDALYLYAGAAAELRPGEIVHPGFAWNNAGDASSRDTTAFSDKPGWLGGAPVVEFHDSFDRLRWAGVMSRFYTTLISPNEDQPGKTWSERFLLDHSKDKYKDDSAAAQDYAIHGGVSIPPLDLAAAEAKSYHFQLYLGPKIYHTLLKLEPERGHTGVMLYGWFTPVSRFLVYWLRKFHDWLGGWGSAIILLTCCIRGVLWPVQARSNASMKRMSMLSPKMKELQEKYKDDPTRMNSEVMKLYKEYGVNPIGGCLPVFIQIPIFFGFYRVLQNAAELRSQSWLWVQDLSMPDTVAHVLGYPLNILPLLMGVTMIAQMKLTPQPQTTDKMQQNIMMFMPLIFLWISYNFASALALYWTAQNIFSIAQAQIQRRFQKDPVLVKVAVTPPAKPGNSAFLPGAPGSDKKKKDKPSPPRAGGGGTKSRGKQPD
jgi:YidC/Oxa1 family membrane protein insertase